MCKRGSGKRSQRLARMATLNMMNSWDSLTWMQFVVKLCGCSRQFRLFRECNKVIFFDLLKFLTKIPSHSIRQDVVLPLLFPIKAADGKTEIKEIPLKKNTGVIVSLMNVNRCKAIWGEDADQWKPDRWMKPLPESVAAAHLPGVYASMWVLSALFCFDRSFWAKRKPGWLSSEEDERACKRTKFGFLVHSQWQMSYLIQRV